MDSSYDRILFEVGNEGLYQKKFDVIYNVVCASLWAMAYYSIIFALTVTPHTCKLLEKPEHISEIEWKSRYIPKLKEAGTEKYSECKIYTPEGENETQACSDYDYDTTWYETTVVSDNNWVCDKDIYVANINAYIKIGEMVGSIFFGWFGDVYGRKLTYVIAIALQVIGRFISIIASSSFGLFALGCVIAAFPSWSAPQCATIISLEISSPKRRSTVAKIRLVANSLGMFIVPFLFWWLRTWQSFLIIITVLQLPCLLWTWNLIESPQWLWINGKTKAALRNLKKIAKTNKSKITPDTEAEILTSSAGKTSDTEILGLLALFSGWRIAVNTILQLLIWISVTVNYTISVWSSGEKSDGNPFLSFAWQALAEIPGNFIGAWLADAIGRRYTGIISFSLTSMIWIIEGSRAFRVIFALLGNPEYRVTYYVCLFLRHALPVSIGFSVYVTNRCCMTVAYYIINLLNMELYPTCLRQSGMSLGNVVSGAASSIAPYILHLGRRFDDRYPSVILVATTILCGVLPAFFLPETRNARLPENLEDARKFGSRRPTHSSVNVPEEIEINL